MAAPTDTFCDPGLGSDTGTGTVGDPYGRASGSVVQWVLDNITRDASNGDRINIKSGTDDVLSAALDLSTYGTPTQPTALIFQGYDTAQGDGGKGGIDANNSTYAVFESSSLDYIRFVDLHLHNCGSSTYVVRCDNYSSVVRCEIDGCDGYGARLNQYGNIIECNFHNLGGTGTTYAAYANQYSTIEGCWYKQESTRKVTRVFGAGSAGVEIRGNFVTCDGTVESGIRKQNANQKILHNSVLSTTAGTKWGINDTGTQVTGEVVGNIVEGYSGTGGVGIERQVGVDQARFSHNAAYNNTTDYETWDEHADIDEDNESLGASAFAKSGSNTFENRFVYFAPNNTGNVIGGLINGQDKGAVQSAAGGGGGGLIPIFSSSSLLKR